MLTDLQWSLASLLMPHPKWHRVFSAICLYLYQVAACPWFWRHHRPILLASEILWAVNTSYRFAAQGCSMKMWKVAVTHCIFIKSWCMYFVFRSSNVFHNEAVCKIWNSKWLKPRISYAISLGTITYCFSSLPCAEVLNLGCARCYPKPKSTSLHKWFCSAHEENTQSEEGSQSL